MELTIFDRDDNISQVRLTGKLDGVAVDKWAARFHAATSGRTQPALVDLSQLSYVNSIGIGLLFASAKKLHQSGYRMILVSPRPEVMRVFQIVGVHEVIPVTDTLEEGIRIAQESLARR